MPLQWKCQRDNDAKHAVKIVKQWFQKINMTGLRNPLLTENLLKTGKLEKNFK